MIIHLVSDSDCYYNYVFIINRQTVQQEFSSLKMEMEKVAELYNILFKQLGAQSTE